mmetsp:Transcript_21346/g.9843  ORF Transcript_21346/g.9843 Transcript_21346/m.9843 type:complete len:215 (+) Transcript_21346:53-697(+)
MSKSFFPFLFLPPFLVLIELLDISLLLLLPFLKLLLLLLPLLLLGLLLFLLLGFLFLLLVVQFLFLLSLRFSWKRRRTLPFLTCLDLSFLGLQLLFFIFGLFLFFRLLGTGLTRYTFLTLTTTFFSFRCFGSYLWCRRLHSFGWHLRLLLLLRRGLFFTITFRPDVYNVLTIFRCFGLFCLTFATLTTYLSTLLSFFCFSSRQFGFFTARFIVS